MANTYTPKDIAQDIAKAKNIDVPTAAKRVRSIMRADFTDVVKLDPTVKNAKERKNDGNRWTVNAKVRAHVLKRAGVEASK